MRALYEESFELKDISEPDYMTLLTWWSAWPEARAELLDFWARGGYVQRLLWRRNNPRHSITVGVSYIDELESALKRLALLGLEVDFVWLGDVSETSLIIAPQHAEYEGVGGWGYATCAGDSFNEDRLGSEWVPAIACANRVPDTLTDWISEHASDFFLTGQAFIAPVQSIGLSRNLNDGISYPYEDFSKTTTVLNTTKKYNIINELDLFSVENMSIKDIYKFCVDYGPELCHFRNSLSLLFDSDDLDVGEAKKQIDDAVREIEQSSKFSGMRNSLIAAGGVLATFNLGIAEGIVGKALGAGFVAHAALQWWCERTISKREARNKPYWPVWKLKKGKIRGDFHPSRLSQGVSPLAAVNTTVQPSHWLAPPTPGWHVPTAIRS